jgi:UDP-glucose 4-epimerase
MHYIVTGGAGFIGSHLAEELAGRHEVTILDNLSTGKRENVRSFVEQENVSFLEGSVTDRVLLEEIFDGADGIFHQAAQIYVQQSIEDPAQTHEINVTGTLNVLLAARACNIRKVVCASSAAIYGDHPALPKSEEMMPDPLTPYAASKLAGEYYGKVFSELYSMQTVFLRYFNVFGPRQDPESQYAAVIPKFITRLLAGNSPVIYGDGLQSRDFIFVGDVVRANIMAMDSDAVGVYNIARGERISLNELVSLMSSYFGKQIDPVYADSLPGDVRHSVADISKAAGAFDFNPEYQMMDALKETIEWFRSQVGGTQ